MAFVDNYSPCHSGAGGVLELVHRVVMLRIVPQNERSNRVAKLGEGLAYRVEGLYTRYQQPDETEHDMPKFTANVVLGDDLYVDLVAAPLRTAGFEVEEHPEVNGLVVQKESLNEGNFLTELDVRLRAWGTDYIIDDHGEAG